MKPNEQAQVNFIADCLRKGEKRAEVLAKFVKKWQKAGTRTFDRRLRQAEKAVSEEQARIREQAEEGIKEEVGALKGKIMTSVERKVYLTKIATGEIELPYTEVKWDANQKKFVTIKFVELAPHTARIAAIAELNKMEGDHAPKKTDLTSNGKEITIHFKDAE